MKKNIGTSDRIIRLVLGIVLLTLTFFVTGLVAKIILVLLGIFTVYESLAGWCALYALLGRNTCPIE